MKRSEIALFLVLLPCFSVLADQEYSEVRINGISGESVAATYLDSAILVNPALPALNIRKDNAVVMPVRAPALGVEMVDRDRMSEIIDSFSNAYNELALAITITGNNNSHYHDQRIRDSRALKGSSAYVSAISGLSVAFPYQNMPMAIFFQSELSAIDVEDIAFSDSGQSDTAQSNAAMSRMGSLNNLDVNIAAEVDALEPQGQMIGGTVSDLGVALSFPLSIVNMPISMGISPKLQRIDTYSYVANGNHFGDSDFDEAQYRNDESHFNVDIGIAIQPLDGLTLAVSGRNLISQSVDSIKVDRQSFTYQVEPLVTAGVAYDWSMLSVSSDIDLIENQKFKELDGAQYWRLGGEVRAFDWMSVRVGYRHDMKDSSADIYSLGSGFMIGESFSLDFTGMFGDGDAIGGVLQTSYHF